MKWWNTQLPDTLRQCSYFYELITAAALDHAPILTDEWPGTLSNLFGFLSQHAFAQPILFRGYNDTSSVRLPPHPVIVLDPVNSTNNVTATWNLDLKYGFLKRIRQTHEYILLAQEAERRGQYDSAFAWWCQIFGNDFKSKSR